MTTTSSLRATVVVGGVVLWPAASVVLIVSSVGSVPASELWEKLLTAVDIVSGAGERGVDHRVQRQRGDVVGSHHAPDRQRGAQLVAAGVELVAKQVRGEWRVHETRRDQVDADGSQL